MDFYTYMLKNKQEFPNLINWFDKIKDNSKYVVVSTNDYYFILNLSKNKICRVESINPRIHLSDILLEIDKFLPHKQIVYVPLSKPNVITRFTDAGFRLELRIKDKYVKGKDVYLLVKGVKNDNVSSGMD